MPVSAKYLRKEHSEYLNEEEESLFITLRIIFSNDTLWQDWLLLL